MLAQSKVFVAPKPCSMPWAQSVAASYPFTMNVYADGVLRRAQTVADDRPFRLPSGFLARDWEFEVVGTVEIYSISIAESMEDLKNG